MSLMQLPATNSSAKIIFSISYALLPFQLCMQPHRYSRLLGGLFKLKNTTTLAFQKLKYALPVNVSMLGIGIAGFSATFSSNIITISQIWSTLNLFLSSNECTYDLCLSYDTSSATIRLDYVMTSIKTSPNFPEFLQSARITAVIFWIFSLLFLHSPICNEQKSYTFGISKLLA